MFLAVYEGCLLPLNLLQLCQFLHLRRYITGFSDWNNVGSLPFRYPMREWKSESEVNSTLSGDIDPMIQLQGSSTLDFRQKHQVIAMHYISLKMSHYSISMSVSISYPAVNSQYFTAGTILSLQLLIFMLCCTDFYCNTKNKMKSTIMWDSTFSNGDPCI